MLAQRAEEVEAAGEGAVEAGEGAGGVGLEPAGKADRVKAPAAFDQGKPIEREAEQRLGEIRQKPEIWRVGAVSAGGGALARAGRAEVAHWDGLAAVVEENIIRTYRMCVKVFCPGFCVVSGVGCGRAPHPAGGFWFLAWAGPMCGAMRVLTLLAALLVLPSVAWARPVVLELFTSLACSSCPPADLLLSGLATEPGIIALDMHVDYWDRLGWRDPYSNPEFTARQQAYAARVGQSEVYTPELVVDGTRSMVGSDRAAVMDAIAAARGGVDVPVGLARAGGLVRVTVGGGRGRATVLLAGVATTRTTAVGGGENGGRRLSEANIVLSFGQVGRWDGAAMSLAVPTPPGDAVVALLQADDGRMLGAAILR